MLQLGRKLGRAVIIYGLEWFARLFLDIFKGFPKDEISGLLSLARRLD